MKYLAVLFVALCAIAVAHAYPGYASISVAPRLVRPAITTKTYVNSVAPIATAVVAPAPALLEVSPVLVGSKPYLTGSYGYGGNSNNGAGYGGNW